MHWVIWTHDGNTLIILILYIRKQAGKSQRRKTKLCLPSLVPIDLYTASMPQRKF